VLQFEVIYALTDKSQPINTIGYGQLDKILVCEVDHNNVYKDLRAKTLILALITPCKTDGNDASESIVGYKEFAAPVIMDIRSIKAVVGRVQTRGEIFIIDRSVKPTAFHNDSGSESCESDSD